MGQAQQKHRAVLIVEDDAELRSLTAALLEDEEIDTIECESAEAALAVMLIGGVLGLANIPVPFVEPGILASAVVLGLMVTFAVNPPHSHRSFPEARS